MAVGQSVVRGMLGEAFWCVRCLCVLQCLCFRLSERRESLVSMLVFPERRHSLKTENSGQREGCGLPACLPPRDAVLITADGPRLCRCVNTVVYCSWEKLPPRPLSC